MNVVNEYRMDSKIRDGMILGFASVIHEDLE